MRTSKACTQCVLATVATSACALPIAVNTQLLHETALYEGTGIDRATVASMSTATLPIRKFMSIFPHALGPTRSLAYARGMMHDNGIRHLPVVAEGSVVGLLCEHDLQLAGRLGQAGADSLTVADAMSRAVYLVDADTPLREVATAMADRKLDTAVVMRGENPIGIFTTVDACRALATMATGARAEI